MIFVKEENSLIVYWEIGGSVICLVGIIYYGVITCLPTLFMKIVSQRLGQKPNTIIHSDKISYQNRTVVIPCPDFLYSLVSVNLTIATDAILFTAPKMTYGSLGVYDDMARCVNIANHSNTSLKALIIGPQVIATDLELQELYPNTNILRLSSSRGNLLHRFLMPFPEDYESLRQTQLNEINSEVIHLPNHFTSSFYSSPSLLIKFLLSLIWSPITILLSGPLFAMLLSLHSRTITIFSWNISFFTTLISITLLSTLLTLPLVFHSLIFFKQPSIASKIGIMKLTEINLWKFNTLEAFGDLASSNSRSSSSLFRLSSLSPTHIFDPFRNLVFFLHGALGLTPKEVQYGGTLQVYSHPPPPSFPPSLPSSPSDLLKGSGEGLTEYIQYEGCYSIDIPSLSLSCEWWSITLYGHDLFLLPTPDHIYSINSHQLLTIHNRLTTALQRIDPITPLPPFVYRVICSPERPMLTSFPDYVKQIRIYLNSPDYDPRTPLFIPVFWIPILPTTGHQPQNSLPEEKREAVSPRFILRAYVPQSSNWLEEMQKDNMGSRLPTIHRIPADWIHSASSSSSLSSSTPSS